MDVALPLSVATGGAIGAPARYLTDRYVTDRFDSALPFGTLAANVSGSLLFGLLTGLGLTHKAGPVLLALLGTGFCGAFTTFSTFTVETLRLLEDGELVPAFVNMAVSLVAGLAGAAAGVAIGLAV